MSAGRPRSVRPELSKASWRKTRTYVRRRDGNRCTECGSDGWIREHVTASGRFVKGRFLLVVGHIVPAEQYGGHHDDPTNLRTLCSSCNNSQRDLTNEQWQAAKAARGASAVITRSYGHRTPSRAYGSRAPRIY